jgi:dTMP kinase
MPAVKRHIEFDLELRENPYNGLYIALEGTEGSGKTTQVERLKDYFESKGREVITTREPRKEGIIGELVHKILLGDLKLEPVAFQYLFSADRMLNHADVVEPALKDGKIVLSDRSFWSAVVYGVLDKGEEYNVENVDRLLVAQSVLSFYHQFIVPDFTFYLRIPVEISLERLKNERKQAKEIYEDESKIKRTINGYDELFDEFKDVITEVDGTKNIEEVTTQIIEKVGDRV